jgi:hypothetical protein
MNLVSDRDTRLEDFAAELANSTYPVMLRRGPTAPWIKLELGLWKALVETVQEWGSPPRPAANEIPTWQEKFLGALTGRALAFARCNGVVEPRQEIEAGLAQAFRQVMRRNTYVK